VFREWIERRPLLAREFIYRALNKEIARSVARLISAGTSGL
jgi:hypothetical protein